MKRRSKRNKFCLVRKKRLHFSSTAAVIISGSNDEELFFEEKGATNSHVWAHASARISYPIIPKTVPSLTGSHGGGDTSCWLKGSVGSILFLCLIITKIYLVALLCAQNFLKVDRKKNKKYSNMCRYTVE